MINATTVLEKPFAPLTSGGAHLFARVKAKKVKMSDNLAKDGPSHEWTVRLVSVRDQRDEACFAELFSHFAPRIKGFLIKSGATPTLAEECAQEAMATVWQKAAQFDPERASAATWIFTIARNKKIDALRKSARPEPEDLPWGPEPAADAVDAMALQQETDQLAKAMEDLPKNQRDIISRAFFGELTHAELAAETGLPLGTIKSRIRLALDRMRKSLS